MTVNTGIMIPAFIVRYGRISHDEIAARSSIGYYLFSPPGENERLMLEAGFTCLNVVDTTEQAALTAARWHQARQNYKNG